MQLASWGYLKNFSSLKIYGIRLLLIIRKFLCLCGKRENLIDDMKNINKASRSFIIRTMSTKVCVKNINQIKLHGQSKGWCGNSFSWYERQRRGFGFEFLDCVEGAVKSILENPEMYKTYYFTYRGCVIRRFSFLGILYSWRYRSCGAFSFWQ